MIPFEYSSDLGAPLVTYPCDYLAISNIWGPDTSMIRIESETNYAVACSPIDSLANSGFITNKRELYKLSLMLNNYYAIRSDINYKLNAHFCTAQLVSISPCSVLES